MLSHFTREDPLIASLLSTIDLSTWFTPRPSEDHFYNLTRNIIYQQLAGKAASAIFTRFEQLLGSRVTPAQVLRYTDQDYRAIGLSWAKAKYVRDLAQKVHSHTLDLAPLDSLTDEAVIARLTEVKGIGRWTAEMFLLFTLHREDIFSYGDLGLKNGFAKLYNRKNPTPADITAVVSRWHPYSSYGSIALWHFLDQG